MCIFIYLLLQYRIKFNIIIVSYQKLDKNWRICMCVCFCFALFIFSVHKMCVRHGRDIHFVSSLFFAIEQYLLQFCLFFFFKVIVRKKVWIYNKMCVIERLQNLMYVYVCVRCGRWEALHECFCECINCIVQRHPNTIKWFLLAFERWHLRRHAFVVIHRNKKEKFVFFCLLFFLIFELLVKNS